MALTEDHIGAAVAVQVRDRDITGAAAGEARSPRFIKALLAAPVDP